jgi:hypothetical protein
MCRETPQIFTKFFSGTAELDLHCYGSDQPGRGLLRKRLDWFDSVCRQTILVPRVFIVGVVLTLAFGIGAARRFSR